MDWVRSPTGRRVAIVAACLAMGVLVIAGWLSWPHLRLWYLFESIGKNAQGYLEYRHRQTGIVFVSLPGGKFWMGAQAKDPNGRNYDPEAEDGEGPVHEVTLSPFMIGKFEVTEAQWQAVMGETVSCIYGENCPVSKTTFDKALEFGKKTGLTLSTEAQWEYACRDGATTLNPTTRRCENLDRAGWYLKNSGGKAHPVGEKEPNRSHQTDRIEALNRRRV